MVITMLLSQLLFAATAASFLVVPEAPALDEDTVTALPIDVHTFDLPPTALSQSLDLPCRRCRGQDAHLKMDFAVEDGSRLTLNGFELYPNADPWHGDLSASVVRGNGKEREQKLGYSLAVKPEGVDEVQQMEVIAVELRVIEVGNRFVDGIPSVKVKLVRAPTREILIGSLDINETAPSKCLSMWCRAKDMFGDAFKGFGCSKSRHGHSMQDEPNHPPRPGHHGRPPHHKAGHHRQWRHLLRNMASHIFLPVLMGITAGFGVALFAMCLCRLAIRLTSLVNGDRQLVFIRCPRRQRSRAPEFVRDEEKAALMADEEPPQYEDAPKN
ncbi:hypothetical protein HJFPF1_04905 [Paramyrothecium foliicola]|nr:hypothetical protein HJFPF1_04905 [Paramyrothecium foliicola]